ncbi:MAG: hypothetical protein JWO70_5319 [Betaproteobacteria bacterium]|nr:hypothetical protein [Betaproteobacteria bacterium]
MPAGSRTHLRYFEARFGYGPIIFARPFVYGCEPLRTVQVATVGGNHSTNSKRGFMRIVRKQQIALAVATALGLTAITGAHAAGSAVQSFNVAVAAINELSVSGNPGTLTVNSATAGSAPNAATDASTTYAITSNETNKKITAQLDVDMPSGITLGVLLAAPTGATATSQSLSTVAADVVTGISKLNESAKSITYTLSATAAAGTLTSAGKQVTFTIIDGGA